MAETIHPASIVEETRRRYLTYALSVITSRALPDVRDGLKPVHRRILYCMFHELSLHFDRRPVKCARITGDVTGKFHPHSDEAVYDSLVRMSQNWVLRETLVDGHGNFGSVDGDSAAAKRYTEAKLTAIADALLAELRQQTVPMRPNYSNTQDEPVVLPAQFPHLLVNGSTGIAVGMATNIPPHNLREIIDATLRVIRNGDIRCEELLLDVPVEGGGPLLGVKGPDFPTAGIIFGTAGIRQYLTTGRGKIIMRARASFEPMLTKNGKSDREMIVVTEIPYQVNKSDLLKKIAELVREKKIEGISDLRDESSREGMRVVIELKRDAQGQIVLNHLYSLTALQSTFGVINLSIVNGQPQVLNLMQTLQHFIAHRREVVTRRTRFELRQAEAQREIIEGLGMATTEVDLVVSTIRSSRDTEEARERLMKLPLKGLEEFVRRAGRPEDEITAAKARTEYFLSERQAKAILEMRLSRLTGLEREKLATEYGELSDFIARCKAILASEKLLLQVIESELLEVREKYGDERKTEITQVAGEISMEDLVANDAMAVTVTIGGYIKRTPLTEYRSQGRGGKGTRAAELKEEDAVTSLFVATAHTDLFFLSDQGRVYTKKVYEIPQAQRAARGRHVNNLLGLSETGERIQSIVPVKEYDEEHFLLTVTKNGTVKRTAMTAYANIRTSGIIAVQIEEGDSLLTGKIVADKAAVLIGTASGMSIRFDLDDVRPMGRGTRGVRGIDLREGDHVIGMDVLEDEQQQVLAISANGYGKRTPIADWRVQNRGGLGIIAMETSERNGPLVALRVVRADDQIMVITNGGQIIRTFVSEIREAGRNTQGVRIIRVGAGEQVVDVEPVADPDDGEAQHLAPITDSLVPPEAPPAKGNGEPETES